ncbi:50S ribosomal protein L11 methyltransferase [Asanoa ishikariensis]|uniref:Predicted nicotinamide N-methyase n=1 Tax=Asanoa ishikariensis TaxID=137265 RepID=A0A1H3RTY7_9ACTN|nr:50S ribosomal protein L11 methyltransferase [Asanoa ishikariensis]GIF66824.1 50S ribosomal protein L11 methyltransferase [Asanoa ishikariensis]SDZ29174.1 Predicted nicotinamide N-methyase [Asanoa ishikariensis]
MTDLADAFVRLHARLAPVPLTPEIVLHQADEPIGLWELTEGQFRSEQPPPFWAFAWAGGQGLARYVLDNPSVVAGRRVLDVACGSGLVGIAAALSGAASVRAVDIDPLSIAAVSVNAAANGVTVTADLADILDGPADADVVLAGDVFYSQAFATRMFGFLRRARKAGADAYAGDPGRAFRPGAAGTEVASYEVPTTMALESVTTKQTSVWRLP